MTTLMAMPDSLAPITTTGGAGSITSNPDPAKKKKAAQPKQFDLNFLAQLMPLISGNMAQGPPQFNYTPNMLPATSNFDFSSFFQGLPQMQAATSNFDLASILNNPAMAQAASVNYDPRNWLGNAPSAAAVGVGFNPNQFLTGKEDWMAKLSQAAGPLAAIRAKMEGLQALPTLDPETMASLQAMTDASRGAVDMQYETDKQALLNDLFGRGMQRSTIALDQGGRLDYGHAQAIRQALADAATRELGARQTTGAYNLQNLLGQGGLAAQEGQFAFEEAGLRSQNAIAQMNAALQAAVQNAQLGTQANLANAGFQAQYGLTAAEQALQTAMQNAQFGQQANLANMDAQNQFSQLLAQLGLQQSQFNAGNQQQASQFNTGLQWDAASQQAGMGLQQALANAGFTQQANQQNSQQGFEAALQNYQGNYNYGNFLMQMLQEVLSRSMQRSLGNKELNFKQRELEQQAALAREEMANRIKLAQMSKPGWFSQLMGGVGSALGGVGGLITGIGGLGKPR